MEQDRIRNIIKRWPSRRALAADLDLDISVVHRWWQRRSINGRYDAMLLEAASRRNIPLNWKELVDARAAHNDHCGQRTATYQGQPAHTITHKRKNGSDQSGHEGYRDA